MFMEKVSELAQQDTEPGGSFLLWLGVAAGVVALIFVLSKTMKSKGASGTKSGAEFRPSLTAEDVEAVRFQPPKLGERGYEPEQVGQLLDQAVRELRRLADENRRLQLKKSDPLSQPVLLDNPVLTPDQVVNQKFSTMRFPKGCSPSKVDDFLDRIVVGLRQWNAANEQLRSEISGNTLGGFSSTGRN